MSATPDVASPQAIAAVKAAKNHRRWGAFATERYLQKRNVPCRLSSAAFDFEHRREIKRHNDAIYGLIERLKDKGYL